MAKAELELDIARSTIELAADILETWLNYSGYDRELIVRVQKNGHKHIVLNEYERITIKMTKRESEVDQ